jgi:glycine/D-amino acid oxidase-like deaminating enzyme
MPRGSIRVARLPVDPGRSGWNEILPPLPPAQPLADRLSADWLVIGAGFAGLAAARRLSLLAPGDRIVVLEARRIAEGPAGRNSGFMIDLPHHLASTDYAGALEADRAAIAANRAAIGFATETAAAFGIGTDALDPAGKINAAATEKGLAANAAYALHLSRLGEPHRLLDAAEMRSITGTDYYRGGLFTPGTVILQPALFVRSVANGLRSNRVQIFEGSPVQAMERRAGSWVATTPAGTVAAPRAILAVNGHAESFGFFTGRLLHVFTYASMTRALTPAEAARLGGRARWGVTPSDPMGTTVRRISTPGGDRIVVRNRFTCDPSMEVGPSRIARVARDHDRAFGARFPALSGVEMAYRWGGRLCLSRNDVPAFGEVDDGLFAACCQNGLGTAKGTLAGMLAADLAAGRRSDLLDRMVAGPAPQRLPPPPFARIGATAVIRWGEFRAGGEL